jgi:monofunctional glycosyltransferase
MAKKKTIQALKKKTTKKQSFWKRAIRFVLWIMTGFIVLSFALVSLYRFVNPPVTPLMMIRITQQLTSGKDARLQKKWIDIEDVSPNMIRAVIAAEDNLFVKHWGIDTKAVKRAVEHNKKSERKRGASTISQQTAKNVFLWPTRSFTRKGFELYFTLLIEWIWGKERIMEVYLNVIETGNGIYGVEKASQTYFKKSSSRLTQGEAALIAALLPSPLKYSVTSPGPYMQKRQGQIQSLMGKIETLKIED